MTDNTPSITPPTIYSQNAIDYIKTNFGDEIARQSALLDVSAGAVAGSMVKEYNGNFSNMLLQNHMDEIASRAISFATSTSLEFYLRDYQTAAMTPPTTVLGTIEYYARKMNNPYLVDAGPANIRIGKAIENIDYYFSTHPENPLGLSTNYRNNPVAVAQALLAGDATLTVAAQTVEIRLAQDFINNVLTVNGKLGEFDAKSQQWRDSILVTLNCNGLDASANNSILPDGSINPTYFPEPGAGNSGGENHLYNSERLKDAFGLSEYNGPQANEFETISSQTYELLYPLLLPSDPLREPSASFVSYTLPNVATLQVGGTLSDIVAIERANGNLITVDDLRLANGLTSEMDTSLRVGQQLVVPTKADGKLVAAYGNTSFEFDRTEDTIDLNFGNGAGARYDSSGGVVSSITYAEDSTVYSRLDVLGQPTGETRTEYNSGIAETRFTTGIVEIESADRAELTTRWPDGNETVQNFTTGALDVTFRAATGEVLSVTYRDPAGDGSTATTTFSYPGGTVAVIDQSTNVAVITRPDGSQETRTDFDPFDPSVAGAVDWYTPPGTEASASDTPVDVRLSWGLQTSGVSDLHWNEQGQAVDASGNPINLGGGHIRVSQDLPSVLAPMPTLSTSISYGIYGGQQVYGIHYPGISGISRGVSQVTTFTNYTDGNGVRHDDFSFNWVPDPFETWTPKPIYSNPVRSGCFVGETPILMADGSEKPIADIRVGDHVMAFDGLGELVPRRVMRTFKYEDREVMEMHLRQSTSSLSLNSLA